MRSRIAEAQVKDREKVGGASLLAKNSHVSGSNEFAGRGILSQITAADQRRIEVPMLTPHLDYRRIDESRTLFISERFNTMIVGRIYGALAPLLDGSRTRQDIIGTLVSTHTATAVDAALASLTSRGFLVSGEHSMERAQAAYWSSLGASPRRAQECLATELTLLGDANKLSPFLTDMGMILRTNRNAGLTVIASADYLHERHTACNRQHLESGVPWLLMRPMGMEALFGPIFRPADHGPCWACLGYRLRAHQEVHNFVRNFAGNDAAFVPRASVPAYLDAVHGLIAVEIAKWLVFGKEAPLHEHALTVDSVHLKITRHRVVRRPQCPVCGDQDLFRPDRTPIPVRLQQSPMNVLNSGGMRSVTPDATLARYRHLVSHISGIVTWVERTSDESDSWLHTHWAGSNFALGCSSLEVLRRSLRSKAAGKGSNSLQSEASALCEAVERYCGALHGDEIMYLKRLREFDIEGGAIHPNEVQLFSNRQLDDADRINALNHPYNFVPERFNPDAPTNWTPIWSFTKDCHRFLPTSLLYSTPPEQRRRGIKADSNGCAAGNTLEEAILQGFFELVERDAFAIWWYNRVVRPGVAIESFDDPFLTSAKSYYHSVGRDLRVLDITHDLGIPVFVAVSRRIGTEEEDIIYGAGAHTDAKIALLRSVCELNQFLNWLGASRKGNPGSEINEPMCIDWFKHARMEDHLWLEAAPDLLARSKSDYSTPKVRDARECVEECRSLIEAKGMEFLVLNQTRPDIGMPVARVVVPGMRHFWERFAPGRLFEVPVQMGWREQPVAEADLNPAPVII